MSMESPLHVSLLDYGPVTIVHLAGSLTDGSGASLAEAGDGLGGNCIFDLQGVTDFDDEGLGHLRQLAEQLQRGGRLALFSQDESLHKALETSGLALFKTRDDALASFPL